MFNVSFVYSQIYLEFASFSNQHFEIKCEIYGPSILLFSSFFLYSQYLRQQQNLWNDNIYF